VTARIAHIFPDSPFLPFTVDTFEAVAPGASTFMVYALRGDLDRHPRPATATLTGVSADAQGLAQVSRVVADSDVVIAHTMSPFAARAVLAAPRRTLKVWSGWGGDYYGSDFSAVAGLLGPQTERYRRARLSAASTVLNPLKRRITSQVLHSVAKVTDVFSAPIPSDLEVFARRFRGFRGRYSQLNYASVEDTFAAGALEITGDDILVGNSATLPNNHFEVLDLLARLDLGSRRVIVPLSYGDPVYADAVVKRGTEVLGSNFVPLRDFMPIEQYQQVISQCSVVVMGHLRQQAIGNIAGALWSGAHVFLDERSPMTTFLRERNGLSGSLDELAAAGLPAGRVTGRQLAGHRTLLQDFWGRSVVLGNIETLLSAAPAAG
jgi:dTDP-N-acetylfucosamine:lipid II N-acetylfucosaminyltransferase